MGRRYPPIFKPNAIWFTNHTSIYEFFKLAVDTNIRYQNKYVLKSIYIGYGPFLAPTHRKSGKRKFVVHLEFTHNKYFSLTTKYTDAPPLRGFPLSYWRCRSTHERLFLEQIRYQYEKRHILAFLSGKLPKNHNSAVYRFLSHPLSECHLLRVICLWCL